MLAFAFANIARKRHSSAEEPDQISKMSSMYLLYNAIFLRNSSMIGVSSQIMKIVAYVTEKEVPMAVPIFCRNVPSKPSHST